MLTATDARYLPGGDRYDDRRTLTRRTRRYRRAIVVLIVPPVDDTAKDRPLTRDRR